MKSKNTKNKKVNKKKEINEKKEEVKINDNEENIKKEKEKKSEIKDNKIETKFEWDEGGNIVYVTGSFCEWKEFYLMKKTDETKYSLSLLLPRGFHQYKFKVDDVWTYSKKQPKFEDNGNVNNFIDTTDYDNLEDEKNDELNNTNTNEQEQQKKENDERNEEIKKKGKEQIKLEEKKKEDSKEQKKKKIVLEENKMPIIKRNSSTDIHFLAKNSYSIYYPLRSEFSEKPSALPGLYKTYYILNEKKNKKQVERKFSLIEYVDGNNSLTENYSEISQKSQSQSLNSSLFFTNDISPHVKFQNLYHIHSNHLHSKEVIYLNTTVTSIISRYRFKFSTFIYYNENKPKNDLCLKKHSNTIRIKRGNTKINRKK